MLSPSLQKKAVFMVHIRQTRGRRGAQLSPPRRRCTGNAPRFPPFLRTHPQTTSILSLKLKQMFAFRRPAAAGLAGPSSMLVPQDPKSAAGQLDSPGFLVLGALDGRPLCPEMGLRACVPWMPGCQSRKALRRPAPVLYVQEPEAQRWTWSSDHTPWAQLGLVPLWGPLCLFYSSRRCSLTGWP